MEKTVLMANRRDFIGKKVKIIRKEGKLPGVIYGKDTKPVPITLDMRDATIILRKTTSSSLLVVSVDGEEYNTLVRERQKDFILGTYLHIDFLVVSLTEKVNAFVRIVLIGDSPAAKNFDGLVITGLDRVEVEGLPQDLPELLEVDVSVLENIGDGLYVKDIPFPSNIVALSDLEDMVAIVTSQAVEEEEEEEEEIDEYGGAEPEVIEKGKEEVEDSEE